MTRSPREHPPLPPLGDADVAGLRVRLAAGEHPRVVLRRASGHLAAGARGEVVGVDDDPSAAEPVSVSIGGDRLPFGPEELSLPRRPGAAVAGDGSAPAGRRMQGAEGPVPAVAPLGRATGRAGASATGMRAVEVAVPARSERVPKDGQPEEPALGLGTLEPPRTVGPREESAVEPVPASPRSSSAASSDAPVLMDTGGPRVRAKRSARRGAVDAAPAGSTTSPVPPPAVPPRAARSTSSPAPAASVRSTSSPAAAAPVRSGSSVPPAPVPLVLTLQFDGEQWLLSAVADDSDVVRSQPLPMTAVLDLAAASGHRYVGRLVGETAKTARRRLAERAATLRAQLKEVEDTLTGLPPSR